MTETFGVSHSGRLPITSPVVGEPTRVQEEGHGLRPAVEYLLAVDVSHRKYSPHIQ